MITFPLGCALDKSIRAFPSYFVNFLYFTSLKYHFSILSNYFSNKPHISVFILQYILLYYYKIIFYFLFFPHIPPTPSNSSRHHKFNYHLKKKKKKNLTNSEYQKPNHNNNSQIQIQHAKNPIT